jgi:hypothetical protein
MFNNVFRAGYEITWKIYGGTRQATDDNIILRMRFTSWITKATDTHLQYVILMLFRDNNGHANAPLYYVTRSLPLLLIINV